MLILILVLLFPPAPGPGELEFLVPDFEYPFYAMIFPLEVTEEGTILEKLEINGRRWSNYFIFQKAKNFDPTRPLPKGLFTVQIDYAWKGGRDYAAVLYYTPGEGRTLKKVRAEARSPRELGIPGGEEGYYRVFRLEESTGIKRIREIVTLACPFPETGDSATGIQVYEEEKRIPHQVLDVKRSVPPEKSALQHPETVTYKIAVPVDLAPYSKKMLLAVRGQKGKAEPPGFKIHQPREGSGRIVRGERLALEFSPQSGQIHTLEYLREKVKLYNEAGVVHWNPGCFVPGLAWDHSFNWKSPPGYEERMGPFLFISSRRGPLQTIRDVELEIRYTLPADAPYVISETRLSFTRDRGVVAVRNDEMVLYKELFDSYIYRDKKNKIIKAPLREMPGYPDGFVHRAPADLPWVGLVNSAENYGFFSLRLAYANSNLSAAGSWLHKAGTYFYAPVDGKYVYWVRPLLYTWSEYPTRNLLTHVEAGSWFYEKNAYILLSLDEGYIEKLERLLLRLRNPVRVY